MKVIKVLEKIDKKQPARASLMTKIISAFPGTGKTHLAATSALSILDSDSIAYSWLSKGVRNPQFPGNYLQHIKDCIGKTDLILVSSHEQVRRGLVSEGIEFTLVYPQIELVEEYLNRYRQRGSTEEFVSILNSNWKAWISDMEQQQGCKHVRLSSNQYLSDIVDQL